MKPIIGLLFVLASLSACSTSESGTKKAILTSCTPGDPGKPVLLEKNSYAPEGRVVRLAPQ